MPLYSPPVVAPFPWQRLTSLPRSSVALHRRVARRLPPLRLRDLRAGLTELVGEVELTDGGVHVCAPGCLAASLGDPLVGVVLVAPTGDRLVLELAPELALALVDRLVGGEGAAAAATGPLTDVERGVVLYAAARLLISTSWRAAAVVTAPLAVAAVVGDEGSAVWSTMLHFGAARGIARVWVPARFAKGEAPPRSLRGVGVTLSVALGEAELRAAELASLRPGDVIVLDACWWRTEHLARVRVDGARRTTWWCDEELRVIRIETGHDAPTGEGAIMNDETGTSGDTDTAENTDVVTRVGDAPVVLTVEVARVRMPLEELARLREGEVLVTGCPIGARVVLRAGDEVIGEGELVDVEGEVGVRLLAVG